MTNLWDFTSRRPNSTFVPPPPPSPEKSSFAQTCNRLSQFLKENGSLRDLGIDIAGTGKVEPNGKLETNARNSFPASEKMREKLVNYELVDLFPGHAASTPTASKQSSTMELDPKKSQMSIFYGGQVYVFDDFPAEKVAELMLLAHRGISQEGENQKSSPFAAATGSSNGMAHQVQSLPQAAGKDIPIARRASLHRFFEKRKDRAVAVAPYQVHGGHHYLSLPSSSKDEEQLALRL